MVHIIKYFKDKEDKYLKDFIVDDNQVFMTPARRVPMELGVGEGNKPHY